MRRTLLLALAAAPLAGCGFRLRGAQTLPFESIYLGVPANSPLGAELTRNIRAGTATKVVDERKDAQAVFELINEWREREVLAVNTQGRTREYQLRLRIAFRVHDGRGRDYIGPTLVQVQRDIAFNESQVLAREAEESLMFRDMQSDIVQQVLRRLAAIRV
jgi:LPS-assembly lipoprotein